MITEQALQEAITECQGERNPNASTCIKLASFYTIQDRMFGNRGNSYEAEPKVVYRDREYKYESNTEFGNLISGKNISEIMPLIDELMSTLKLVNPRLYASVIRRLTK